MIQFPVITHIDQVRESIKDRPEFIEADRGDYIVFNYMVAHSDSFDCPVRRECRGLIFCKHTGKVLSRRFHKFFNMGEKEETMPHNLDLSKPHVILEKLDGSMITPLVFHKEDEEGEYFDLQWATKMGVTEIGLMVENYLTRDINLAKKYVHFVMDCLDHNQTPIFEYTGPYNRIVLDHQEESLVLLAIRSNENGDYMPYVGLADLAKFYDVPLVQPYQGSIDDLARATDIEGVVIRFDDGHMVKVKTDWYVAIHKAKENILFEKNVLRLILEEKIDDVLPHLPEADRLRLEAYQNGINDVIDNVCVKIGQTILYCGGKMLTRKDFAINVAPGLHPIVKKICFMVWDNQSLNVREEVVKSLLKLCSSQVDIDKNRDILGVKWNPTGDIDHVGRSS